MSDDDRLADLESKLAALAAKDEIWQLIARYARAVDEEDDAELGAIYTADATCETVPWSKGKVFRGRDTIVKLFKGYQARFENRKRFITNERIDVTGADTASGWSNWLVLHANAGEPYVGWGSYEFDFRRISGTWLIAKMVVRVDCMTTLQDGWGDAEKLLAHFPR